jgi:hypothetical protein
MPLPPIPPEPNPSPAEYSKYLDQPFTPDCPEQIRVAFAGLSWKYYARQREPNLFLVPFKPMTDTEYQAYLRQPLWQAIRERVLTAAGYECACCDNRATDVHHRDYRPNVMSGEDLSPLVALCRKCHRKVDGIKGKETWNRAEALLADLVAKKDARLAADGVAGQLARNKDEESKAP